MTLQTLGTFKKTDTGFEGRIQTLLSNLKLYIEEVVAELQESDKSADYVIKSKYSLVGYGWHGTDDVVEGVDYAVEPVSKIQAVPAASVYKRTSNSG